MSEGITPIQGGPNILPTGPGAPGSGEGKKPMGGIGGGSLQALKQEYPELYKLLQIGIFMQVNKEEKKAEQRRKRRIKENR